MQYDDAVLQCFLENQEQLFPETEDRKLFVMSCHSAIICTGQAGKSLEVFID